MPRRATSGPPIDRPHRPSPPRGRGRCGSRGRPFPGPRLIGRIRVAALGDGLVDERVESNPAAAPRTRTAPRSFRSRSIRSRRPAFPRGAEAASARMAATSAITGSRRASSSSLSSRRMESTLLSSEASADTGGAASFSSVWRTEASSARTSFNIASWAWTGSATGFAACGADTVARERGDVEDLAELASVRQYEARRSASDAPGEQRGFHRLQANCSKRAWSR